MVKIVADSAIPWLDKLFAKHGEIVCYSGREINQAELMDADLLLIRSTLKITKPLLAGTTVKLVASATVGCDHVDQNALQELGIAFVHAPGCNANAVAEYVVAALAWHENQGKMSFAQGQTAAVIGCGQIGSTVKRKLEILGFDVVVNDPPLQQLNSARTHSWKFVNLNQALESDVICLHTPLTISGAYPTYHLISQQELEQIHTNAILINAGRGEVIDNQALLRTLENNPDLNVVLDVWENEPTINNQLLNKINLGTPHIAGHSWRGKVMGTIMIYQQICNYFNWSQQTIDESDLRIQLPVFELNKTNKLYDAIAQCYDIEADSNRLRLCIADKTDLDLAKEFDQLRKHYFKRPEFCDLSFFTNKSGLTNLLLKLEFSQLPN